MTPSYDYLLVDAYSYAVRFHKCDTNADYGDRFIEKILTVRRDHAPSSIVWVIWDMDGGADLRREIDAGYKSNRVDYHPNFFTVKEKLSKGLTSIFHQAIPLAGEADDVISMMSAKLAVAGKTSLIASNDKDMLQSVQCPGSKSHQLRNDKIYTRTEVELEFGNILFYLALVGDSSDCITGVPGIGPKRAKDALRSVTGMNAVYSGDDELFRMSCYEADRETSKALTMIMQHRDKFLHAIELIRPRTVEYSKIHANQSLREFKQFLDKNGYVNAYSAL